MESQSEYRFDEPGALAAPGPIGRAVRLTMGLLLLWVVCRLLFRSDLTDLLHPPFWFGTIIAFWVCPAVISIGWGREWTNRQVRLAAVFVGIAGAAPLLALPACRASGTPEQTNLSSNSDRLQEAKNAFFKLDLETARAFFEEALKEPLRPAAQRAEAARNLAHIAWRFDQNWAVANDLLRRAEELAPGEFDTTFEQTRLLAGQGKLAEAVTAARRALSQADTRENQIRSDATIGELLLQRVRSDPGMLPKLRGEIRTALDALLPTVRQDPGRLDPARIALGLALAVDDGAAALAAWRSYYQVPRSVAESPAAVHSEWDFPMMSKAHQTVSRVLPEWRGPSASPEDRVEAALGLAASKFFAEAARLVNDAHLSSPATIHENPLVSDIVAYANFMERVEQLTDRLYRLRALGKTARPGFDEELRSAARVLWERLHFPEERPAFSDQRFWREISERFGAEVYFRSDGGGRAVHVGHRVIEEKRQVEQYGRSATIHFAVLDCLATNGYSSWFWDGRAATGGWVEKGIVVQVRSSYASKPLKAWSELNDPEARKKLDEEIREKSAGDDDRARKDPAAYLPGLALRLKLQAYERLLSELKARGLQGQDLKAEFVTELGRLIRASSIFAHEGRHALERENLPWNWMRSGAEKEFLAKLSEVALAPDPRIGLVGGILSANIGDGSSHGQANQRIMRGLVAWMEKHSSEISGLDPSRPLLPQLDLLSDEQLRQAFRSQDPWAR